MTFKPQLENAHVNILSSTGPCNKADCYRWIIDSCSRKLWFDARISNDDVSAKKSKASTWEPSNRRDRNKNRSATFLPESATCSTAFSFYLLSPFDFMKKSEEANERMNMFMICNRIVENVYKLSSRAFTLLPHSLQQLKSLAYKFIPVDSEEVRNWFFRLVGS